MFNIQEKLKPRFVVDLVELVDLVDLVEADERGEKGIFNFPFRFNSIRGLGAGRIERDQDGEKIFVLKQGYKKRRG